jgi:hypothetical protein
MEFINFLILDIFGYKKEVLSSLNRMLRLSFTGLDLLNSFLLVRISRTENGIGFHNLKWRYLRKSTNVSSFQHLEHVPLFLPLEKCLLRKIKLIRLPRYKQISIYESALLTSLYHIVATRRIAMPCRRHYILRMKRFVGTSWSMAMTNEEFDDHFRQNDVMVPYGKVRSVETLRRLYGCEWIAHPQPMAH